MKQETHELMERFIEMCRSPKNQNNKKYWDNANEPFLYERWRGRSSRRTNTPFAMAMDVSGYAEVLNIDCKRYFTEPAYQIHEQLRYELWEAENFDCQRYFEQSINCNTGIALVADWFGSETKYPDGQAPWFDMSSELVKNLEDLERIKQPIDFRSGGPCTRIVKFYEEAKELCSGYDIKVEMPQLGISPFGLAIKLMGFDNVMLSFYENPELLHAVLRYTTDCIKQYAKARADYMGEDIAPIWLGNDDISTPNISPALYREFIMPYELELCEFGKVWYWHSCGNTDAFFETLAELPTLKMMHIGPWSDYAKAAEVFGSRDVALEICLSGTGDIYDRTEEEMYRKLCSIKEACDGKVRYYVRADGLAVNSDIESDLAKIRLWNKVALKVFPG